MTYESGYEKLWRQETTAEGSGLQLGSEVLDVRGQRCEINSEGREGVAALTVGNTSSTSLWYQIMSLI